MSMLSISMICVLYTILSIYVSIILSKQDLVVSDEHA